MKQNLTQTKFHFWRQTMDNTERFIKIARDAFVAFLYDPELPTDVVDMFELAIRREIMKDQEINETNSTNTTYTGLING